MMRFLATVSASALVAAVVALASTPTVGKFKKTDVVQAVPVPVGMFKGVNAARPTLLSTESFTTAGVQTTSWSKSFTVPANCNLLILTVSSRHSAAASTFSVTFNGSAMTSVAAWAADAGNRCGCGIYSVANPATGARTITGTFSAAATGTMVAHYFIGNTTTPTANGSVNTGGNNLSSLSITFTPGTNQPYIVACASHRTNSAGVWTYSNLSTTVAYDENASQNNVYVAAANATLTGAGSTTFTINQTAISGNQAICMAICEVRMI